MFAFQESNEELVSRIHKELLILNSKAKESNPVRTSEDRNRHCTKEELQTATNHGKRCAASSH